MVQVFLKYPLCWRHISPCIVVWKFLHNCYKLSTSTTVVNSICILNRIIKATIFIFLKYVQLWALFWNCVLKTCPTSHNSDLAVSNLHPTLGVLSTQTVFLLLWERYGETYSLTVPGASGRRRQQLRYIFTWSRYLTPRYFHMTWLLYWKKSECGVQQANGSGQTQVPG